MRRFIHGTAFKISLIIVAALLIGTGAATLLHSKTTPVNTVVSTLLSPLQRASAYIAGQFSYVSGSFRSATFYSEELEALKKENDKLKEQLVDFEKAKQKNEMYQQFFGLKEEHSDFQFVEAAVIGRDAAAEQCVGFTLSKGSKAGIAVNDPVIFGKNLVGIVSEVSLLQCKVKTLLSTALNASVYEVGTNETGYVTTTKELAAQGLCRMPSLERTTAIAPGGVVCTSGITGIFPRDLMVGTVTQVLDDTMDISSYAVIQPSAPLQDLKDVFVITGFAGQAGAGEDAQ